MSTALAPRPQNEERRVVAVKRTGIIDGKQADNFSIFCEMAILIKPKKKRCFIFNLRSIFYDF